MYITVHLYLRGAIWGWHRLMQCGREIFDLTLNQEEFRSGGSRAVVLPSGRDSCNVRMRITMQYRELYSTKSNSSDSTESEIHIQMTSE